MFFDIGIVGDNVSHKLKRNKTLNKKIITQATRNTFHALIFLFKRKITYFKNLYFERRCHI